MAVVELPELTLVLGDLRQQTRIIQWWHTDDLAQAQAGQRRLHNVLRRHDNGGGNLNDENCTMVEAFCRQD